MNYVFGPVPSRRLGYSLGINHIPPKHCPYSCVYCQVGRTTHLEIDRREFYSFDRVLQAIETKIAECSKAGRVIDYLTLVPDGEPTLDLHLGKLIEGLKKFGIPIAVISNSSIINRQDVQEGLLHADWVSLKVDSVYENEWHTVNRPHQRLSLSAILDGMLTFRKIFHGELVTETMLISGLNDSETSILRLCDFLLDLRPVKSYLSIPTRPPAEHWVNPPTSESLQQILQLVSDRISFMDLLFETETGDFISTGNLAEDILSITAVHPLREEALHKMTTQAGADWSLVEDLITSREITSIQYRHERYYLRCLDRDIIQNGKAESS
jgi:wyosine [tRNA(Phe)-imidazoG37] synthetase (radical SAM superfamily)